MGEKKVTIMVLKVDLQCEKCYKKVKEVLCKFPQIRDQTYDEKNNQVIIKVVCCSPEKIRDKLCCKGGGAIKSIDILPEKPKEKPKEEKPKEKPKEEKPKEKPKEEKPKETPPKVVEKPQEIPKEEKPNLTQPPVTAYPPVTVNVCCIVCYGRHPGCPCQIRDAEKSKPTSPPPPPPVVPANPPMTGSTCCMDCYGGHPGGPCQTGYGYGGAEPYIEYDGYYGSPVYDSYGGGRSYSTSSYCLTRPDCFSEENPQACAIM